MKQVTFGSIPLTGFFKESDSEQAAWHMKTSDTTATYKAHGVEGEPTFDKEELVFIE